MKAQAKHSIPVPHSSSILVMMKQEKKSLVDFQEIINALKTENTALRGGIQAFQSAKYRPNRKAYEESQNQFRTIFELSALGNKIISPDLKITQVNPAMVTLLGYDSKDELIGTRILDYSPSNHHEHWENLQQQLWHNSTPTFGLETTLVKKDGTVIWVSVHSILFPDKGQVFGYTIIEDITEKHTLRAIYEELLTTTNQLKTNALEEVAFDQAHLVRAPLANMLGIISIIKEIEVSEDVKRLMLLLEESSIQLDNQIKNIVRKTNLYT